MVSKKCLVSGRVQGVYYRATCQRRARELGVRGYARNLADGRVEVLAYGEARAVSQLIEWLWEGSAASRVEAVDVSDAPQHGTRPPEGFQTA